MAVLVSWVYCLAHDEADRQRRRHQRWWPDRRRRCGEPNGAYGAPAGPRHGGNIDESKSQRPDEQLLTGDTANKVRAAALANYPGATVLRVETDSDGVYEAHLSTTDGRRF
jgi:hypothetical protein